MKSRTSPWRTAVFLAAWAIALGSSTPPTGAATGGSAAVVIEMGLGKQGTATEMIGTPKVGLPLRDPTWIYVLLPDGTLNPALPVPLPPLAVPIPAGIPVAVIDLSGAFPAGNTPQSRTTVRDNLATMRNVLFPTCTVLAASEWQDSGILVTAGQRFQLTAQGQWFLDKAGGVPSEGCGPDGLPTSDPAGHDPPLAGHPPWPKPDEKGGALIARIGNGPPFLVGAGGTFTADRTGPLWFVCNDLFDGGAPGGNCVYCTIPRMTHLSNNTGSVQVSFSVVP